MVGLKMTEIKEGMKVERKPLLMPGSSQNLKLSSGDRVAVIGSGQVGSFFSFFLIRIG